MKVEQICMHGFPQLSYLITIIIYYVLRQARGFYLLGEAG